MLTQCSWDTTPPLVLTSNRKPPSLFSIVALLYTPSWQKIAMLKKDVPTQWRRVRKEGRVLYLSEDWLSCPFPVFVCITQLEKAFFEKSWTFDCIIIFSLSFFASNHNITIIKWFVILPTSLDWVLFIRGTTKWPRGILWSYEPYINLIHNQRDVFFFLHLHSFQEELYGRRSCGGYWFLAKISSHANWYSLSTTW